MDERRFAEQLTARYKIPFVPMELTGSLFRSTLAHVTWLEDLLLTHANSVAYHLVSKVARAHGVIVVLSGEGADELFGGYAWNYRRRLRLARLQPWLRRLPAAVQDALALLVYSQAGPAGDAAPVPRAVAADHRRARSLRPRRCGRALHRGLRLRRRPGAARGPGRHAGRSRRFPGATAAQARPQDDHWKRRSSAASRFSTTGWCIRRSTCRCSGR